VTRFPIKWDDSPEEMPPEQAEADQGDALTLEEMGQGEGEDEEEDDENQEMDEEDDLQDAGEGAGEGWGNEGQHIATHMARSVVADYRL
jgi:hypothetical protein